MPPQLSRLPAFSSSSRKLCNPRLPATIKVACIEEIAYEMGYISKTQLIKLAQPFVKNQYGQYLLRRANEKTSTQ
jgi:dTDP-glucose pyrophosphorylase